MFLFICELEYFGLVFRECQHSVQFNVNIPLSIARESRKHFPDERIDTKRAASRQVHRVWEREREHELKWKILHFFLAQASAFRSVRRVRSICSSASSSVLLILSVGPLFCGV